MVPRRATRSTPASPPKVPEQPGTDEVRELRAQVTAFVGAMQRQEERMEKLQDLVSQQATATAPVSQDVPATAEPATVPPVLATTHPVVFGPSCSDSVAIEAEHERSLSVLTVFMRFNPPMFNGVVIDPWAMDTWLTFMEALFKDIYTLEKDKVHLAAHCFEKDAQVWWRRTKQKRSPDHPPITWDEFWELLFMEYLPDSDKRKMKEDFCKLRQENSSVREYEQEFSHLVNCVPGMIHRDRDRTECFERGLRLEVFKIIHAFKLKIFEEVLDRALWVERGCDCA
ncbi:uncharacterized protein LOC109721168 [Ananas comosus]|uniref:Uncharacterized protein LOC109721168 n=1 Tax=Ananas comosus TaxID=4615 RepID=A0A6P5G8S4_ANACO|nr:uncharacterized protein LOC109721168 [Ananas comosus]XP_020104203.1 uncharacterized protein LOC109721168 [Ananas comosus]XP_020104204.1 uncharacterized protein LOC109721168 [Ananas comosus]